MLKFSCCLPVVLWASSLLATPVVTGVAPYYGGIAGGNSVTITGSGFTGTTSVQFGTKSATGVIVNSDTSISAIVPPGVPEVVNVTVTAGTTSAASHNDAYAYQGSWRIYVTNDVVPGFITPVNIPANTFEAPIPVGDGPVADNLIEQGERCMVINSISNDLTFLDLATGTTTSTLPVGIGPLFGTVNASNTIAYIPNNGDGTVSVVNLVGTPSLITTIPIGGGPFRVTLSRDGLSGYVSDGLLDQITVFSTATNMVTGVIVLPVNTDPAGMSVSADDSELYVVSFGTGTVLRVSTTTHTIVGAPIPVGMQPVSIAVRNKIGYITNLGSNSVSIVDFTTYTVSNTINGVVAPFRIGLTADGLMAYVSNTSANTVTPIDLVTLTPGAPIGGFLLPIGVAVTRDQTPLAEFTMVGAPVGSPCQFDGSGSVSPTGTIAKYDWDFGDSTTLSTASPTVQHTYTSSGTFNVRLTVTNTAGTSVVNDSDAFATLVQPITIASSEVLPPSRFSATLGQKKHSHRLKFDAS